MRLYPRRWRNRYGAELAELIDGMDAGLGDAADIGRSAIQERLNGGVVMRFEPAHRHPGSFAVAGLVLMLPTLALATSSIIGYELGVSAVAQAIDPVITSITSVRAIDLGLVVAPLVGFALAMLPAMYLRLDSDPSGRAFSLRIHAMSANLVVGALALLLGLVLIAHIVTESVVRVGQ